MLSHILAPLANSTHPDDGLAACHEFSLTAMPGSLRPRAAWRESIASLAGMLLFLTIAWASIHKMPVAWPSQTALSFGKSVGGCLIVALLGRLLVALLRRRLALALHRPSPILAPKQHTVLKSAGSVHSSLVEASSTRNREPCTSSPAQEGPKQRAPIVVSSQKASVVDAGPAVTAAPTAAAAPLAVAPAPLGPTALALSQSRAGPVLLARVCMVKPGAVLQSLGSNTSSNTTNGSSSLSTTADTELMSDSGGGAIGGVAPVIAHIMETPRDLAGGTGCSPHRSGRSPQVQVRRYVGRTRLQRTAIKVHGVEPSQVGGCVAG